MSDLIRINAVSLLRLLLAGSLLLVGQLGQAQTSGVQAEAAPASATAERSIADWLMRLHEASRRRAYIGTLVVSSGGAMASSRIWHVCDGEKQMERVESLSGTPRSTFRRNDEVITFSPQSKVAVTERRESLGLFPHLLKSPDSAIDQFYSARAQGSERVAGFEADVVQLAPKDKLRFGYRIWSEKKTGLVVKLQTLDADGQVLEQVAFSELQLDAPVSMDKLTQMMRSTEGYKLEKPELVKTTAAAEGWQLKSPVPGFKPMSCYRRPAGTEPEARDSLVQWVFSDGLASVSLFIAPFDRRRHGTEGLMAMGATHTLARRIGDKPTDKAGGWWLTVVGEVPAPTLQAFALGLERKK
jgi:sigma-E factor negative regulatory protein RseB